MRLIVLDPKKTHENNPNCPMRLIRDALDGGIHCFDCGLKIMCVGVPIEVKEDELNKEMA